MRMPHSPPKIRMVGPLISLLQRSKRGTVAVSGDSQNQRMNELTDLPKSEPLTPNMPQCTSRRRPSGKSGPAVHRERDRTMTRRLPVDLPPTARVVMRVCATRSGEYEGVREGDDEDETRSLLPQAQSPFLDGSGPSTSPFPPLPLQPVRTGQRTGALRHRS